LSVTVATPSTKLHRKCFGAKLAASKLTRSFLRRA
jgi:hypothetical protein